MLYVRVAGAALLIIGLIMLIFGFQATESITGQLAETLSRTAESQTAWMLGGGIVLAIFGILLVVFGHQLFEKD